MGNSWLRERSAGIFMHISSLPNAYGIGNFGASAYRFIDFLEKSSLRYWQICPLSPTGYGNSPYQGLSNFAINPYFIDLYALLDENLLGKEDIASLESLPNDRVDYGALHLHFWKIVRKLAKTFKNFKDLESFENQNPWLNSYALFCALKTHFSEQSWQTWPETFKNYKNIDNNSFPKELSEQVFIHKVLQYIAFKQWAKLRKYAHLKNIEIIGDMAFYPGLDSADVWSNSENFLLDENLDPRFLAGVPPDFFSADGQLWGNPVYDWTFLKSSKYSWWKRRIQHHFELYDVVRLDHFRAFENFWAVPSPEKSAKHGTWMDGPGAHFFSECNLLGQNFIAEDLGVLDQRSKMLLAETNYPGMTVLQFAFSNESNNPYLPHYHEKNSVLYLGTHDNDTLLGWYNHLDNSIKNQIRKYFGISNEQVSWKFFQEIYRSPCNLSITMVQDLLGLDSSARFNTPGTSNKNWEWRLSDSQLRYLVNEISPELKHYAQLYNR